MCWTKRDALLARMGRCHGNLGSFHPLAITSARTREVERKRETKDCQRERASEREEMTEIEGVKGRPRER